MQGAVFSDHLLLGQAEALTLEVIPRAFLNWLQLVIGCNSRGECRFLVAAPPSLTGTNAVLQEFLLPLENAFCTGSTWGQISLPMEL